MKKRFLKPITILSMVILITLISLISTLAVDGEEPIRKEFSKEVTDQNGNVWHIKGWVEFKILLLPPFVDLLDYDVWVTDPDGNKYRFRPNTGIVNQNDCNNQNGTWHDDLCLYLYDQAGNPVDINLIPYILIYDAIKAECN